jgi:hypothetical protein
MRLIAGSGRSGTTWVQDAIATANGLRPVFEPLHPYVSDIGNRYAHCALSADDVEPELERFLSEVCAGRSNRLWTQYRRRGHWLLPPPSEFESKQDAARVYNQWAKFLKELPRLAMAARRAQPLVKCIRANLMLGWLSRRLGWKVVLVVRHPGAVIESELRSGWNARFALDRFRRDATLHRLTGDRYRGLLGRNLSPVEEFAVRWVIENQWVTESAPENGVTVVHYEHLKSAPEVEWRRVRVALGLDWAPPREVLARPSQQSAPKRSAARAIKSAPRWISALSREQASEIQGVLEIADVALYSMSDPEPRISPGPETRGSCSARAAP